MADNSGVPSTDLELLLEFDNDHTDSSGNGRNQSPKIGAALYDSDGAVAQATKLRSSQLNFIDTGVASLGDASLFADSGEAWTVAAWVKFENDAKSSAITLVSRYEGENLEPLTQGTGLLLIQLAAGSVTNNLYIVARGSQSYFTVDNDPGVWHLVALTWDGTDLKLYYDGALVDGDVSVGSQSDVSTLNIMIGAYRRDGSDFGGMFNSLLDDFRVYARALSAGEVNMLYGYGGGDSGSGSVVPQDLELLLEFDDEDLTDGSVHERDQDDNLVNGPLTFVGGKVGDKAARFTASSEQHIATGVQAFGDATLFSDASNSFSVTAWVKHPGGMGGIGMVISRRMSGTGFRLRVTNGGAEVYLRGQLNNYTLTGNDDGEWHHYAVTWDGGSTTAKFYYDGSAQSDPTNGSDTEGTEDILIGTLDPIGGGNPANFSLFFDAHMDDLRIYSRAITADELSDIRTEVDDAFSTELSLDSVVGTDATVRVTFGRDIDTDTFVLGDITLTNGTASNLTEISSSVFTFDVEADSNGTVSASLAAGVVEDDSGVGNAASDTLSWGVGAVGGGGGLSQFDRGASRSGQTGSLKIGPIAISQDAGYKSVVGKARVVLGADTDATGTVNFHAGIDGEDAAKRADNDGEQYSTTIANLINQDGVCFPRVSGHALIIELDITEGHCVLEQIQLEIKPSGKNRQTRFVP